MTPPVPPGLPMTRRPVKEPAAGVGPDQLRVCPITDRRRVPPERWLRAIEAALEGGIRDLQLREKDLPASEQSALARELRRLTRRYGARLIVNDRLDIALLAGADGVHLPEQGLPAAEVKARFPDLWVGVSTHSLEGAQKAQQAGADYITFSPVFDTPSKRAYGPPQGLDKLAEVTRALSVPVIALGGITLENLPEVLRCGVHGVALIRGLWDSPNIKETASRYMQAFQGEPS